MARPRKPDAKTNAERQAAHRAREGKKIRFALEPWADELLRQMALAAGKTPNSLAAEMLMRAMQTMRRSQARKESASSKADRKAADAKSQLDLLLDDPDP